MTRGAHGAIGINAVTRLLTGTAVMTVALLLPFVLDSTYQQDILNQILIFIVLASGYNVALGYTGMFSLGHIGLFAIGAYTSALLTTKHGVAFPVALVLSIGATGIAGLVLAALAVRVKGHYLALLTLAFAGVVQLVLINEEPITGGAGGVTNIPRPSAGPWHISTRQQLYFFLLICAIIAVFGVRSLDRSRFGRAFRAVRDSEIAADVNGVGLARVKILAFVLSALYAGWAGSLYAHTLLYVSPEFFSIGLLVVLLAIVLLGGRGTVYGPVVGAIVLVVLPEALRFVKEYYLIVFGLSIWAMAVFWPEGIVGSFDRAIRRRST